MPTDPSDRELWSWIDRGAPELDVYLASHPGARPRVQRIRESIALASRGAAAARLPESVGPYRVLSLLGSGGMGIVYEAMQPSPRRRVAVKVLPPDAESDDRRVRLFRREAEALGRLSHPSIAAIHESGRTDDGRDYFVMELVPGLPLDRHVRERALPREERLRLFLEIADAVHHAHERGVVHRDLKPTNILVAPDGRPKILDFGLARLLDSGASGSLTASGDGLLGTLPYMSPEQVRGGAGAADARSDVYALGVLLAEMLTGKRPIDVEGTGVPEAARRICEERPRPPSAVDPSCRGNLDAIVLRAVEKAPESRYGSAAAMAEDVRRHLAGGAVARPRPRRRRLALAGGALAVALVSAVALFLLFHDGAEAVPRFPTIDADGEIPTAAPFSGVRFAGDVPQVEIDGEWFELVSIDGDPASEIVAYCRDKYDAIWEKRFGEDLVEVLLGRHGVMPRTRVDLVLRDAKTGATIERERVPMTPENRRRIWQAKGR